MTSTFDRRQFLDRSKKASLGLAAGLTIVRSAKSVRAAPANEKLILAIVGLGRGTQLACNLASRGDCQFAYIADVNRHRLAADSKNIIELQGGKPAQCVDDFRTALDDKSVDAVVIATCQHWHALATVWSCQAGKDVYVEKPASHTCWEGIKMVEAARKYDRICQVGTQNRSAPYNFAAKKYIEDGKLGQIHLCKVYQQRVSNPNFKLGPDSDPPDWLNWEMWNGPAPARRFNSTLFSNKNSLWSYGGGDMEADGVHQVDLARWLCGVDYPESVYSTGGRFGSTGDSEVPDTQEIVFQFDELLMTMTYTGYTPYMLKNDPVLRESDMLPYWMQNSTRIEIFGTEGLMCVGRHGGGWQVFVRPKDRKPVVKELAYGRFPDKDHLANFIDCVRNRNRPNADIMEGHRSALMTHLGNISYRLGGEKLVIDPTHGTIVDNQEAMKLFKPPQREGWAIGEEV